MRKRGSRTRAGLEILVTLAALAVAFPTVCARTILRRSSGLQLGSWLAAVEGVLSGIRDPISSAPHYRRHPGKRRFLGGLVTVR
jgi:hypothetical protein